ncbi:MAG TPA: nickel pincer cofactor biosynthesis protein LarC [Cyclobacteriaceae bacterium]|nr:nickel pincer cofactor biosynthesis protein LarC [Cyclobacteriaceae bacterium]
MRAAYFDCFSGISGDMIIGSLLDAGLDFSELEKEIGKLGLGTVRLKAAKTVKRNIASTKFDVIFEDQKRHRHLKDLNAMVENSGIDEEIRDKAKSVFLKIALAESKIHNMPLDQVHFHEIGAVDTIVDVVGSIMGFKKLGIEKVFSSRLNVGSGFVTFSHGTFPVPAPATAEILKNIPTYSTGSVGELVTPTGAALIATLAHEFGDMPPIKVQDIGYGAGTKDFDHPNVLRVYIGEVTEATTFNEVFVIETNIDDMNPQWYDSIMDRLYGNGALEVFLTNIQMKKNRPGIKLTLLSDIENKERLIKIILTETTSIGVRVRRETREILKREIKTFNTPYGPVKAKISYYEGEAINTKIEYDDLKRIAGETGRPIKKISGEITDHLRESGNKNNDLLIPG